MLVYVRGCCPIEFELNTCLEHERAWTLVLRSQITRRSRLTAGAGLTDLIVRLFIHQTGYPSDGDKFLFTFHNRFHSRGVYTTK